MNPGKRHILLVWTIVALIVLNISTIATLLFHRFNNDRSAEVKAYNGPGIDNSQEKFSGRYFRDYLGLTLEQMSRFHEFNPAFREKAREINIRLSTLRGKMLEELSSGNPNNDILDRLADSIGYEHSELKKITSGYYLNLRSICTPDQQLRLRDLFSDVLRSDGPAGNPDRQGRQYRYRGGRQNQQNPKPN